MASAMATLIQTSKVPGTRPFATKTSSHKIGHPNIRAPRYPYASPSWQAIVWRIHLASRVNLFHEFVRRIKIGETYGSEADSRANIAPDNDKQGLCVAGHLQSNVIAIDDSRCAKYCA
jgi:hypothetical protein